MTSMKKIASEGNAHVPARIRKFRASDRGACRGLWAELTHWHRGIYNDSTIGGPDPGVHFDSYLKKHGSKHIWVAEVGGKTVGMAGLIPGDEGPELEPLIVSEEYRRRGIGRHLSEKVIQAARKDGSKMLHVRPVARNDPAIRFFHGCGFDTLGHIEMFLDLTPASRQRWKGGIRIAGKDFRF
jgi:GNAT superfamily N-acetyltransferase